MKLKLGFSPCPNDTFMFDALVNRKISTDGFSFHLYIADVEQLNQLTFENELDITKVSYHVYPYVSANYQLLLTGSALGKHNGPLLISKVKIFPDEINDLKIAIPGKYTTANLLFSIAYPNASNKKEYLFSDIEEAILSNEVDAGLIIHENRFTYEKKGLKKIIDLGEYWEELTKLPVPLGGIIIKRSLPDEVKIKFNNLLKESIRFAFENPTSSLQYIKKYSQELSYEVIRKHIDLYVNKFSINLGEEGKKSINELYRIASEREIIPKMNYEIFID